MFPTLGTFQSAFHQYLKMRITPFQLHLLQEMKNCKLSSKLSAIGLESCADKSKKESFALA
jgi:hypothetical protein